MAAIRISNITTTLIKRSYCSGVSNKLDLTGLYAPITTPFNSDESIAYDKLKNNLEFYEKSPLKGYLVQGSNGEYKLLRDNERVKLIEKARENISKDKILFAGSACESTLATIELSNEMANVGADAVLIINPCYYKSAMTNAAIRNYYCDIADKVKIPLIIYNMPGNTGIELSADLLIECSKHPNIIGVKDSGADVSKMGMVAEKTKNSNFQVLCGSASLLLPSMIVGCVGGINGFANVFPNELCALFKYFNNGKMKEAKDLHHRICLPNLMITRKWGVAATKAIMDAIPDLYGGPCRKPLSPLTTEQLNIVRQTFIQSGFTLT